MRPPILAKWGAETAAGIGVPLRVSRPGKESLVFL
jgi:hypothetical protein